MVKCVECNATVEVPNDTVKGEIIDCPECGIELEVVNPESMELRIAEVEGEDWGE